VPRAEIVVADRDGIARAADRLREGGLVAYPTETWFALGCDPRLPVAVEALRAAKGREAGKALPLLAGSREQAEALVPALRELPAARAIADALWPGPLSLVLPVRPGVLAPGVAAPDGTVAIRWSPHPVAAALARAAGTPLVATSANRAGEPPAGSAAEAARALGSRVPGLLVLDAGPTPGGPPSTLVDPRVPGGRVLREGAIPAEAVRRLLSGEAGGRAGG